ncbi:type-F conjugative transfer system secretin TraK [Vibrio parahaemolyticus]|nr:type-F conjugative transfer system secretin TraK [Vibrio parahaemolyticus]
MMKAVLFLAALITSSAFATERAVFPIDNNVDKKLSSFYVISENHVNRIVTPFSNPSIKLDNVGGVSYQAKDNVLYLATTTKQPIAAFITENGDESAAIKVVLKPESVPPQEIVLNGASLANGSQLARTFERSNPRTKSITNIMAMLVKGDIPLGYQEKEVNAQYIPHCEQNGLVFDFYRGQHYSGGDYVVSIGTVKNTSSQMIEFTENHCYERGVVAVAAHPTLQLLPNQRTEVFVMYNRNKPYSRQSVGRQSLLQGGAHD